MADLSGAVNFENEPTLAFDTFTDWAANNGYKKWVNNNSLWSQVAELFSGKQSRAKSEYETYKTNAKNDYVAALNDFNRRYNEYREDTRYQHLVEDLEAAGLNRFMINSASPSSSAFESKGSSTSASDENESQSSLLKLLGIIALFVKAFV